MNLATMRESFPDQAHLYYDITQAQLDAIAVDKWTVMIDGKIAAATTTPIAELASEEITQ